MQISAVPEVLKGRLKICDNEQIEALKKYTEECEKFEENRDYKVTVIITSEEDIRLEANNEDEAKDEALLRMKKEYLDYELEVDFVKEIEA